MLPAILNLPALRAVIFVANNESQLPDLFEHVVNVIGNPPAVVKFRYACVEEQGSGEVYNEVSRDGKFYDPGIYTFEA